MVRVLTKEELTLEPDLIERLKNSIFIYPTDTIYGLGCDATNDYLVEKLRSLKKRSDQPFSVIVPNKNLVYENCLVESNMKQWLDKLPGPYTLIFKTKKSFFSKLVNPVSDTIGVRIPNHWFSKIVRALDTPIVTTSVNLSGDDFMTCLEDLNTDIKRKVDFIIYDGPLNGRPSNVVHLENGFVEVKTRQ